MSFVVGAQRGRDGYRVAVVSEQHSMTLPKSAVTSEQESMNLPRRVEASGFVSSMGLCHEWGRVIDVTLSLLTLMPAPQ